MRSAGGYGGFALLQRERYPGITGRDSGTGRPGTGDHPLDISGWKLGKFNFRIQPDCRLSKRISGNSSERGMPNL